MPLLPAPAPTTTRLCVWQGTGRTFTAFGPFGLPVGDSADSATASPSGAFPATAGAVPRVCRALFAEIQVSGFRPCCPDVVMPPSRAGLRPDPCGVGGGVGVWVCGCVGGCVGGWVGGGGCCAAPPGIMNHDGYLVDTLRPPYAPPTPPLPHPLNPPAHPRAPIPMCQAREGAEARGASTEPAAMADHTGPLHHRVLCSFFSLYNEVLMDLLRSDRCGGELTISGQPLPLSRPVPPRLALPCRLHGSATVRCVAAAGCPVKPESPAPATGSCPPPLPQGGPQSMPPLHSHYDIPPYAQTALLRYESAVNMVCSSGG